MTENEKAATEESFLIADCGRSTTTVALFDRVNGAHRLIARASAPTTAGPPWSDISVGIKEAVREIAQVTGRSLLTDRDVLIMPARVRGSGVDHFGATVSAAPPLKTVIAGLLENVSVASARHALQTIYADEIRTFSLADSLEEQERINTLLHTHPELILLTGGTDGGDRGRLRRLAETVEVGTSLLDGDRKSHVLFAGNREMREEVSEILEKSSTLQVAENVRPTLETEQLADAIQLLGDLYRSLKIDSLPGIENVKAWTQEPLLPTARAFAGMIDYFAALYGGNVLGLDLGSSSVTLVAATPRQRQLLVCSTLGMGAKLPNLLETVGPEEIVEWSPVELTSARLLSFLQEKALHPATVPMLEEELYLEQTLARHVVRAVRDQALEAWQWKRLPPTSLVVMRGSTLANAPRPGQSLLIMLDALQPTGIFSVAIDQHGVLPALGWLALHAPLVAVQTLEGGALVDLGWVVAADGQAEAGEPALRVTVESEGQGRLEIEVKSGELEVLPLAPGEEAVLTLEPARQFDIGFGRGRGKTVTAYGGAVGLVIDARGRPLSLPADTTARRSLVRQWLWDMGG